MFEKLTGRTPSFIGTVAENQYAVLLPFVKEENSFLFEVRSEKLLRQPGEICFPGGHIEDDESPQAAAIRETCEELLISEKSIEVIAPLDILFTPWQSTVFPFLGELSNYGSTYNIEEVKEVFTVPVSFFLDNSPKVYDIDVLRTPNDNDELYKAIGVEKYAWSKRKEEVLVYNYKGRVIWGMTARFLQNFASIYKNF